MESSKTQLCQIVTRIYPQWTVIVFLLVTIIGLTLGEGPSYEYEPFFYSPRSRSLPQINSDSPSDITLRNQNSHYRSIYRNRNYFVHPQQKSTATSFPGVYRRPTLGSTGSTAFIPRYTSTTPSTTETDPNMNSDSPIIFAETSSTGYVRAVETIQQSTSKSVVSTQVKINGKIQYYPTANGKLRPSCANNALYCESFDAYPTELLNDVLGRTFTPEEFQNIYGDTTDNSTTTTDLKLLERTGLISSNLEETPLCSSVERTIYPRVARNRDNKWMYVVNHDEYIQGVRVEKCLDDDGSPCVFGETAPAGYQTACRQKYIYKKMLALTPEGKTSSDTFKLPSCCVCFAKKVPLVNRLLNTSPATLTTTPQKPSAIEEEPLEPDYDDLPTTVSARHGQGRSRKP